MSVEGVNEAELKRLNMAAVRWWYIQALREKKLFELDGICKEASVWRVELWCVLSGDTTCSG